MRYRAFLSYSHADAAWARWLLRRLEGYRVPQRLVGTPGRDGPLPARLGAMFRDRDELPSAGDLSTTIQAALADSAALVVLCSPTAAQSQWVNAEIDAFRASGRGEQVFAFVVAGDPGGRDPGQACFPPALLRPDLDGDPPREPLAADARPQGDGRERALLKLVAGLLGVGYDQLAQREAQRRHRRLAVLAAASLAGMAIASTLAVSAYVARNDAQRRQAQAEDILGFMLGDLRKKLTTVGRLDLMRSVDDKAMGYFATLDPRDLSDRALEEQARALTGIGQVRLDEGKHDAAMAAFREAHARSTALLQRQPKNGQRLFDLAQAEYWIGFVALEQGRYDETGVWFRKYRDSAIRLAAMDRGNFDWQREVAYGHHNLAVLDDKRGRYAEAEHALREELALYRSWLQQHPDDTALRYEASNVASWLGSLSARQGKLADAEGYFAEQAAGIQRNLKAEPRNAEWQELRVDSLLFLAEAQALRGRRQQASVNIAAAIDFSDALAGLDPSNNSRQVYPAIARWWQAQLDAGADTRSSHQAAEQAGALLTKIHAAEPKNERVLRWLAKARNLQAQLALARGDAATARAHLTDATTLLEPLWKADPSESLRLVLANTQVLAGESAQSTREPVAAQAHWQQAERLLTAEVGQGLSFERLDPLTRTLLHLGRSADAKPHQQRLAAAGYVPLRPFPTAETVVRQ